MALERRALGSELRAAEDGKERTITGYGAVFGSLSEPIGGLARGGFREKILPTAFNACLASNPDIRCTFNHSPEALLGRTKSGTLKLAVNTVGLRYTCVLPDTQQGNSVWESVRRGDVTGSSFGFEAEDDEWDDKGTTRTLRQVKVWDIGPVVWPAYLSSTVAIRSISGSTEMIQINWYKARGLRLPLLNEKEMRAKSKALRQELDGGADDDDAECSCSCESCEGGDCVNCDCSAGCNGMACASDDGENCNCAEQREVQGRMRRVAQGKTIHAVNRELMQRDFEIQNEIFRARQEMKLWRR